MRAATRKRGAGLRAGQCSVPSLGAECLWSKAVQWGLSRQPSREAAAHVWEGGPTCTNYHTLTPSPQPDGRQGTGRQKCVAHQLWGEIESLLCCAAFSSVVGRENITTASPPNTKHSPPPNPPMAGLMFPKDHYQDNQGTLSLLCCQWRERGGRGEEGGGRRGELERERERESERREEGGGSERGEGETREER